jgi:hypothetical protein
VQQHFGDKHYHGPQTKTDRKNRERMLTTVNDFWIKGVLEKSLYQEVLISLGLHADPQAITSQTIHYQGMDLTRGGEQEPHPLPPGTTIAQVFDQPYQRLLILGAPGGGKTTLLLDLARTLIARAQEDETHPIPVVFNLSSWAQQRQPLEKWLVQELREQYGAGKHLAKDWVEQRAILPLLDGLDEVAAPHRAACVDAINAYCREHSPEGVVVCSRLAEFRQMDRPLALDEAVVLQPLNDEQMAAFFERAGEPLAGVRAALEADDELRTLGRVPLRLHIIALAYQGSDPAELIGQPREEQHRRLFDSYVERMFKRPGRTGTGTHPYRPKQTVRWLSWLAGRLVEHNQTVFQFEQMQPTWLDVGFQQNRYSLIISLLSGAMSLSLGCFFGWQVGGVPGIFVGVFLSVFIGFFTFWLSTKVEIKPVEKFRWSWKSFISRLFVTIGIAGVIWFLFNRGIGTVGGEGIAILFSVTFGLLLLMISGITVISNQNTHEGIYNKPNERIWNSLKSSMFVAFLCLFVGLLSVWISLSQFALGVLQGNELNEWINSAFLGAVFFSLFIGIVYGMILGGFAFIQHFALRIILALNNNIPWNLVHFLDYATKRIFLRRVGGSYVFVHRMLMEYFARLTNDEQRTLAEKIPIVKR